MKQTKVLYNVTVKVEHSVVKEWKEYMIQNHILDVMNTGCFLEFKLTQLKYLDETDGITFAIQYIAKNQDQLDKYQREFAMELQRDHQIKFKDKNCG